MITKKQAHIIAAYCYKIVDKYNVQWHIQDIEGSVFHAIADNYKPRRISFEEIGTDYFIQCLPYEALTKEVKGIGVPLVELAKIAFNLEDFQLSDNGVKAISSRFDFDYYNYEKAFRGYNYIYDCKIDIPNQAELFDQLHEWHFPPHGIYKQCLKFKEV